MFCKKNVRNLRMMETKPVTSLLIDLGGVLLSLYESQTSDQFKKLLDPTKLQNIDELVFHPFDRGEIGEESFFNRLQTRSLKIFDGELYRTAWNAMLGSMSLETISTLEELKKKYTLILVSNTNLTHIHFVRKKIAQECGLVDFDRHLFHHSVLSFEVFMRKPERRIFEYILQHYNLNAEECLFIDDKIENTTSASAVGIQTHHMKLNSDFTRTIQELLPSIS